MSSRTEVPIELRRFVPKGSAVPPKPDGEANSFRLGSRVNTRSLSPVSPAGGALSGMNCTVPLV